MAITVTTHGETQGRKETQTPLALHHLPQEPAPRRPGHSLVLDEGIFVDGFDDIFEKDLGGQSVAMVHNRLPVRPVPAVHCGQAEPG